MREEERAGREARRDVLEEVLARTQGAYKVASNLAFHADATGIVPRVGRGATIRRL